MYQKKTEPIYQENDKYANGYRVRYLEGIHHLIEERKKCALEERMNFGRKIAKDRENYRSQYRAMLGWPLTEERKPILRVIENVITEYETRVLSRLQFEMFEGFLFYGVLMRHKTEKSLPLVIAQHGAGGTPEMCSSFFDSENYNDMSVRIFQKGVHVFVPQTSNWGAPRFGKDTNRRELDNILKQLGSSIAALEIDCIQKCIDYFETKEYCNGSFGMAGLSYGGFYTLYTAAAEPRIKAALACSHFNDRTRYHMSDKVWFNAANTFLDAQVAALVCPRFLRIEVGDNDELFAADTAVQEYERLKEYYQEAEDHLEFHVFQGVHEFCPEDTGIEWLISKMIF